MRARLSSTRSGQRRSSRFGQRDQHRVTLDDPEAQRAGHRDLPRPDLGALALRRPGEQEGRLDDVVDPPTAFEDGRHVRRGARPGPGIQPMPSGPPTRGWRNWVSASSARCLTAPASDGSVGTTVASTPTSRYSGPTTTSRRPRPAIGRGAVEHEPADLLAEPERRRRLWARPRAGPRPASPSPAPPTPSASVAGSAQARPTAADDSRASARVSRTPTARPRGGSSRGRGTRAPPAVRRRSRPPPAAGSTRTPPRPAARAAG